MLKLKKIPTEKYDNNGLDKPYLPSLSLDSVQVPEIKDWKVGETYRIVMDIKQTSMSQYKDDKANASFDIIAYKTEDLENIDDADLEDMQGEALSNK